MEERKGVGRRALTAFRRKEAPSGGPRTEMKLLAQVSRVARPHAMTKAWWKRSRRREAKRRAGSARRAALRYVRANAPR